KSEHIPADDRLQAAKSAMHEIRRIAEMSAEIMRDSRRTGGWEGSERVARQFDRIARKALQHE
ncbi:hypothetical protein, partial [Enterococcus faecium]